MSCLNELNVWVLLNDWYVPVKHQMGSVSVTSNSMSRTFQTINCVSKKSCTVIGISPELHILRRKRGYNE